MFAVTDGRFIVFCVFALSVSANRLIRSPDKVEVNFPNHSYEQEDGEYQANMNEEAAYWNGQADKLDDKGKEGHEQIEENRQILQAKFVFTSALILNDVQGPDDRAGIWPEDDKITIPITEKNQENYNHEKDHYTEQENNYKNEMNETYQEDKHKTEAHQESNQEHITQHHNNTNYYLLSQGNKTAEDLPETEAGDRYEEKGTEFIEQGEHKIDNYDANSTSISYTRT